MNPNLPALPSDKADQSNYSPEVQLLLISAAGDYLSKHSLGNEHLSTALAIVGECLSQSLQVITSATPKKAIREAISNGLRERNERLFLYSKTIQELSSPNYIPYPGEYHLYFELGIDKNVVDEAKGELSIASRKYSFPKNEYLHNLKIKNEELIGIATRKILIDTLDLKSLEEVEKTMKIVGNISNESKIIRGYIASKILQYFSVNGDYSAFFFPEVSIEWLTNFGAKGELSANKEAIIDFIAQDLFADLNVHVDLEIEFVNIINVFFNQLEDKTINWTRTDLFREYNDKPNDTKPPIYWERQRAMFAILPLNMLSMSERFVMDRESFNSIEDGQQHIWMDSITVGGHRIPSIIDLMRAKASLKGNRRNMDIFWKLNTVDIALKRLREYSSIKDRNPEIIEKLIYELEELERSMPDIPAEPKLDPNYVFDYARRYNSLGNAEKVYRKRIEIDSHVRQVLRNGTANEQLSEYLYFQIKEQESIVASTRRESNPNEATIRNCHIFNFLIERNPDASQRYKAGGKARLDVLLEQYNYYINLNQINNPTDFEALSSFISTKEFYEYIEDLVIQKEKKGAEIYIKQLERLPRDTYATVNWVVEEIRKAIEAQENLTRLKQKSKEAEAKLQYLKQLNAARDNYDLVLSRLGIDHNTVLEELSIRSLSSVEFLEPVVNGYSNLSKLYNSLRNVIPKYHDLRAIVISPNLLELEKWKAARITQAEGDSVKIRRVEELYSEIWTFLNDTNIPLHQANGIRLDTFMRMLSTRIDTIEAYSNFPKIGPIKAFIQERRRQKTRDRESHKAKRNRLAILSKIKYFEDQYNNADELLLSAMQGLGLALKIDEEQ